VEHPNWLGSVLGRTALVEADARQATGTVAESDGEGVTVVCDQPAWDGGSRQVSISIFGDDALYRLSGQARADGARVVCDPGIDVERIQRRRWPRKRLELRVTLCPVKGTSRFEGVPGRTVDVSVGGLCVETIREVEGDGDPMVILDLPDGTRVVTVATTVASDDLGDGWRYRLAFRDLDSADADRLASLTGA
jgi:PilZ domain